MIIIEKTPYRLINENLDFSLKKYDDFNYEILIKKVGGYYSPKEKEDNKINDLKLDNSISRSRTAIFEYAMTNKFDYFITLTLNPLNHDTFNLDLYIKTLSQYIRDLRKKYNSKIEYLLIPEQHKSGAYHMHGLIRGIPKEYLTINQNGYLDWEDYSKKFGYCSLSKVKNKVAISKYITKYLTKEFALSKKRKNKKLYYVTRGLLRPTRVSTGTIPSEYLFKNIYNVEYYENDYNIKILVNNENIDEIQKLFKERLVFSL